MKKKFSALALVFVMVLTTILQPMAVQAAEVTECNYEVTLPDGYDESQDYPVVYVLPQDGYTIDNSGITEKFQAAMADGSSTEMIIVRPEFTADMDLHAAMETLVAEVDATYSTIADVEHRIVVGTGVGGYLAYILGLTEVVIPVVEEDTTPAEGEDVAPAAEEDTTPAEGEDTTPAEGEDTTPAEGEDTTPTEGEDTTPAEGEDTTPAEGEDTTPAEGEDVAPAAEEEDTTPAAEEEVEPEYATLSAPKLFKYVASIRGDFVSDANPWYAVYGDVYTYLEEMGTAGTLRNFYTYIDAPVTDAWTNMKNSTNDIGSLGISQGLAATCHEFTVRSGSFTDEFLTESVKRIADRMSANVVAGTVSGTVSIPNSVLTSDVEKAKVEYTVNVNNALNGFTSTEEEMTVIISVIDPNTDEVLTSVDFTETVKSGDVLTGTVEVDNLVNGAASTVQLSAVLLGKETVLSTAVLTRIMDTVIDGDNQFIDLMGDWHFNFTGNATIDVESLTTAEFESWSVVQPALDWWKKGFGNINDTTVPLPPYMQGYFEYLIIGNGYYARTFELPAEFDAQDVVLSVGKLDDRGQAYINGHLVGETGMVDGTPNGESAWELYSAYDVDPSILNVGGTNTIVVRCKNDGMGGGGWYEGPIALYSQEAFDNDERTSSLFIEDSFESKYAASAQELEGTVENDYMIYLPEGYHTSDKYYPTVYLMHQYNSTHRSYLVDDIDALVDEAIKQALIDEMIVVVPNSTESSWWAGDWMKMVTEELVPLIDSNYRTIDDARYRFTAGCSMGGQGAYGVALRNPDMFSAAISFFGAFSMGGDASPNYVAQNESKEYLDYFTMYFICGNQDLYQFGVPAIELNQILESKGVEHEFFIENGGHDSPFYVPYFIEAMVYTRDNMYHSDDIVETLMSGEVTVDGTDIKVEFEALAGIDAYYNLIPDSSYTEDATPDLSIPLILYVVQDGEVVHTIVERDHKINEGDTSETFKYDLSEYVDPTKPYSIVYKAAVFDRVVELKSVEVVDGKVVEDTADDGTTDKPSTDKPSTDKPSTDGTSSNKPGSVQTGDNTSIVLYVALAVAAIAAMTAVVIMRKRS